MDTKARDCNCIVFCCKELYFVAVHRLPCGGGWIRRQGIVIVLYFVSGIVIVLYFVAVHRLPCGGGWIRRQGIVIVLYFVAGVVVVL